MAAQPQYNVMAASIPMQQYSVPAATQNVAQVPQFAMLADGTYIMLDAAQVAALTQQYAQAAAPVAAPAAGGFPARAGDWNCPSCNDLQFAKNTVCRRCGTPNPNPNSIEAAAPPGVEAKAGDWVCPSCNDFQFARNVQCRRCGTANPATAGGAVAQAFMPTAGAYVTLAQDSAASSAAMPVAGAPGVVGRVGYPTMPGDWNCPACGDLQFARNTQCRKCGTAHPDPGAAVAAAPASAGPTAMPGDWMCAGCGDHQFARNTQCRRCGAGHPGTTVGQAAAAQVVAAMPTMMTAGGALAGAVAAQGMTMPVQPIHTAPGGMKPGDWVCPGCFDHQFARNAACKRCGTANPSGGAAAAPFGKGSGGAQAKLPGDWVVRSALISSSPGTPSAAAAVNRSPWTETEQVRLQMMAAHVIGQDLLAGSEAEHWPEVRAPRGSQLVPGLAP
eukprot:CAMPEP_0195127064 /NCGR_PEP_ID=MMETSP0448-20130528/136222_1 /TAXON_ID=66468 /ORGANISM="Heterocapsa triquestra, Strain CCMP 448" /LENGTH=443 /DNA_ID=CAMNT_0040164779 /DNA_START=123 /DNA_END=1451 /DNA_ORIENTATION=+